MNLKVAFVSLLAASAPTAARADADIQVAANGSPDARVLPGSTGEISLTISNLGPDNAAPILTAEIGWLYSGYMLSLSQPACGGMTQTGDGDRDAIYTLTLATLPAGEVVICSFEVARDTSAFGASDLRLTWRASADQDPDPDNNSVDFLVGSLIDISIGIIPESFYIDDQGIGHELEKLRVLNHGPSRVYPFVVGACTDNFFPEFYIDGDFPGGCGPVDFSPSCFDYGFGFETPELSAGEPYGCSIQLTSVLPFDGPLGFEIYTNYLGNPDTQGGELLDVRPEDNWTILTLAPFENVIFADGFEP